MQISHAWLSYFYLIDFPNVLISSLAPLVGVVMIFQFNSMERQELLKDYITSVVRTFGFRKFDDLLFLLVEARRVQNTIN